MEIGRRAGALARALDAGGVAHDGRGRRLRRSAAGAHPGSELPTRLVVLERAGSSAEDIQAALRALEPPVVARIENDRVVLDLRTVDPVDDALLEKVLSGA